MIESLSYAEIQRSWMIASLSHRQFLSKVMENGHFWICEICESKHINKFISKSVVYVTKLVR